MNSERDAIQGALAASTIPVEMLELDFYDYGIHPETKIRRRLGEVIYELLATTLGSDAVMVVAPNETLFSNHLAVLAGALQRTPNVNVAATAAVLQAGLNPIHTIHEVIDFGWSNPQGPSGYGRFIFRTSAIPKDIGVALPYLNGRCLAVLVGDSVIEQQLPATINIDVNVEFPAGKFDDAAETAIIRDFSPLALRLAPGVGILASPVAAPAAIATTSLQVLRQAFNRRWLIAQLHALRKQGFAARVQAMKRKLG